MRSELTGIQQGRGCVCSPRAQSVFPNNQWSWNLQRYRQRQYSSEAIEKLRVYFCRDEERNQPTYHHVHFFGLQPCQPLSFKTNSLQVHQDPASHLEPRHHLKKTVQCFIFMVILCISIILFILISSSFYYLLLLSVNYWLITSAKCFLFTQHLYTVENCFLFLHHPILSLT